jgi:hypothetical protein
MTQDPRTASGPGFAERIFDLERRVRALEVAEIRAATTPTANRLLYMDANGQFPAHEVAGNLSCEDDFRQKTDTLYQSCRLGVGYKAGIADDTLTDILLITGPGGVSGSGNRGALLGTLDLLYTGRHTSGYSLAGFWRGTVEAIQPSALSIYLYVTQLSYRSFSTGSHTVTMTVQVKAGATATAAAIEAKVTHPGYDAALNRWYWRFDGLIGANRAENMIMPTNAV